MSKQSSTQSIGKVTILLLVLLIILRIPSLYEPHWYSDEGVYAAVASAMNSGKTLYTQVWDNKPPGIYFLYQLGTFENRLLIVKFFNLISAIIGFFGMLSLTKKLQFSKTAQHVSLAIFTVLFATPLLEGTIANAENFFMPLAIWGLYFGLRKDRIGMFVSGILCGVVFWIKFNPLFDFAALVLFIGISRQNWRTLSEHIYTFLCGFFLLIIGLLIYLLFHNSLIEAINTIFLGNIAYSNYYAHAWYNNETRLVILGVVAGSFALLHKKKIFSNTVTFILLLLVFEYYAVLLSGRDYVHYLLQTVPGVALLAGYGVSRLRNMKSFIIGIAVLVLMFTGVLIFNLGKDGGGIQSPIPYYTSFLGSVTGGQPYFWSDIDVRSAEMQQKLSASYPHANMHIYTDNPWYFDLLQIVPEVSTVTAYHQYFREGGEALYIKELEAFSPDVIIVDTRAFQPQIFKDFLTENYSKDFSDEIFEWHVKKFVNFGDAAQNSMYAF